MDEFNQSRMGDFDHAEGDFNDDSSVHNLLRDQ